VPTIDLTDAELAAVQVCVEGELGVGLKGAFRGVRQTGRGITSRGQPAHSRSELATPPPP
jgi:hypothetical protein